MLDKFITFGGTFWVVVDNGVDSILDVQFHFILGLFQQILINWLRDYHLLLNFIYPSSNQVSLARRIVRLVTDNKNNRLEELKYYLLKRKHPQKLIYYSSRKLFQLRKHESNDKNFIIFTRTYNRNHRFSSNKFKYYIKNTATRELQKAFNDKYHSLLHNSQRN